MVVGLKEKVGRKRRGCPGVMSGESISVVELLQGLIQKEYYTSIARKVPKLAFWPKRLQHNDDPILPLRNTIAFNSSFSSIKEFFIKFVLFTK